MTFISLTEKNTPRWIIFLFDLGICFASVILAYLVRFNFNIPESESARFNLVFPAILGTRVLSFLLSRTYAGIIRYTSTRDAIRVFLTITAGSALFVVYNLFSFKAASFYVIPFSILIIDYL